MIDIYRKYGHCADLMVMFNCRSNSCITIDLQSVYPANSVGLNSIYIAEPCFIFGIDHCIHNLYIFISINKHCLIQSV
jgi:hypothetical protein